jgi:hypothetical protein
VKRNAHGRADRAALLLTGGAALVVSVVMVLLATGAVHHLGHFIDGGGPLLNTRFDGSLIADQTWWQVGAVGVGVVLVVIGVWWLRRQLPPRRVLQDTTFGDLGDGTAGDTIIHGRALANGFEADLRRHPDVIDARADVLLNAGLVRIRLTAADDVDVQQLASEVVRPAIARLAVIADIALEPRTEIDIRLRRRDGRHLN